MNKIKKVSEYFSKHEKILFLSFSLWLCLEYIIVGPFSYVRVGDNLDSFVSRFITSWKIFFSQGLNYWNTFFTGGIDRLSNMASFFDVGSLSFSIFPGWLALGIILVGGSFLGGWYIFRICRKIIGLSYAPSVFASFIFSYSLISLDIIPYILGLSILPVAIYYLEILSTKSGIKVKNYIYAIFLGIIFSFFSSLVLILPFTLTIIAIWFLVIRKKYSLPFIGILILFVIPCVVFHIQEIWSLLINIPFSQRGGESGYFKTGLDVYLFYVRELIFKNWLPLLIFLFGLMFLKIKKRLFIWSSILVFVLLLFPRLFKAFPIIYDDYFKFIADFDFSRFFLLLPFFLSICAAFILHNIQGIVKIGKKNHSRKTYSLKIFITSFLLIILFMTTISLKWQHMTSWFKSGSYLANTYSPDIERLVEDTEDKKPFRAAIISGEKTKVVPTILNFHGLESIDGYTNVTSERNIEFFRIMAKDSTIKSGMYFFGRKSEDEFFNPNLLSLANVRYIASCLPINNPNFSLLLTSSSENYYDWDTMSFKEKILLRLDENFTGRKLLIYENKNVFPRFFLTKKMRVFNGKELLLAELEKASASTLRQEVFLEIDDVKEMLQFHGSLEDIKIQKYSSDEIRLDINSDGPSILIVANNYSPFWKAYVNNKEEKIIPAYHTFMSIILKDNDSEVILRYEPPYVAL